MEVGARACRSKQAERSAGRGAARRGGVRADGVGSADVQFVDLFERRSAAAADQRGAIAAHQRIGDRLAAAGTIKLDGGLFRHEVRWSSLTASAPHCFTGAAASATESARAFTNRSYWLIRSRKTASPKR